MKRKANRLTVADIRNIVSRGIPVTDIKLPVAPEWLDILWKGKIVKINSKGEIK